MWSYVVPHLTKKLGLHSYIEFEHSEKHVTEPSTEKVKSPWYKSLTYICLLRSRDRTVGTVGTVTGHWLRGRGCIPSRGKRFLLYSTAPRQALGHTQPLIRKKVSALFPKIKRPRRETDHSPPFTVEAKTDRAITPLPHTPSWHGAKLIKHKTSKGRRIRRFCSVVKMQNN
jgi:hypothetical protein